MQCRLPRKNVPLLPQIVEISVRYSEENGLDFDAILEGSIVNRTRGHKTYLIERDTTIECYVGDQIEFNTNSYNGNHDSNNFKDDTWIKLDGTIVARGTTSKNAEFTMTITNPIAAAFKINKAGSFSNCSCVTISITTS